VTLCVDIGTHLGWAYVDNGVVLGSGTLDLSPAKGDRPGARYARFAQWLVGQRAKGRIDEVVYEEVFNHKGIGAGHIYGGLVAILQCFCEESHTPYRGIGVQAIKIHATGSGRASKDDVVLWARSNGFRPVDDNEADALALASLVGTGYQKPPTKRRNAKPVTRTKRARRQP